MEQGIKIKNKPLKNDILVYNGTEYENRNLNGILHDLNKSVVELRKSVEMLEIELKNAKNEIKFLKGEE